MMKVSFELSDVQQDLKAMVSDLMQARGSSSRVREVMMTDSGVDDAAWKEIGALGLLGLTVDEQYGGAGATFAELAIVLEELGRRLLPVPVLSSTVLGATVLRSVGSPSQCMEYLPGVAAGTTRLALAYLNEQGRVNAGPDMRAARDGDSWVINGRANYVIDGISADVFVTAADANESMQLYLVPANSPGVTRTRLPVLDLTRPMASIEFSEVRVNATALLSGADPIAGLSAGLSAGAVALACEQVGGAREVLETTTTYVRDRFQFGRAIGSFQAVKHRLVESLVQVETCRSAVQHAVQALAFDDGEELNIMAPLVKSLCSEMYESVAEVGLHLHGGLGFTWEHDAHLYLKRAKASKLLLGDPRHHRRLLADALGL